MSGNPSNWLSHRPALPISSTPTNVNWGGFRGLLKQYAGASAGYSLRKIGSGPVVRLRRASDSAESDFAAAELTDGTAEAWSQSGDAFATTWYDQSGSGNNATQTTAASQPKLITAGVTELENGKPALVFDGTDDYLSSTSVTFPANELSMFAVSSGSDGGYFASSAVELSSVLYDAVYQSATQIQNWSRGATTNISTSVSGAEGIQHLSATTSSSSSSRYLSVDGVLSAENTTDIGSLTPDSIIVGQLRLTGSSESYTGGVQELIIYPSDQSANRTGIETNINDHYGIY